MSSGPGWTRRRALCCGAAAVAGLFTALGGAAGAGRLRNPCRGTLPPDLAQHDRVQAAWDGLDANAVWDVHAHLLGTGDSGSGCTVHTQMHQWWHPGEVMRRHAIMNAACVAPDSPSIDRAYVAQLHRLSEDFPEGARWCLFAFDHALDDQATERADWTTFHVPDDYAASVAQARPRRFAWVASIHPYRADALQRLSAARAGGAVAVKWLPGAMNIDLRERRCRPFYDALARSGLPLIVHCGEEKAVPGARMHDYGNPLLVREPLRHGVRVIVAHAASLGRARDLDQRSQPWRPAFELWARLMDEPQWATLLLGDVSAVFQANRTPAVWRTLLTRRDWHPRLLHGSDHPLPGVLPLHSSQRLVQAGLLDAATAPLIDRLREHNPLLADFVLKRSLRLGAHGLDNTVFETRRHFTAASA